MYARFEKDTLKTVREVDYTNSIPYNAKICLKWLNSKGRNSVKINSRANKIPHAHFQYVPNMYAKFEKDPLKTEGGVDYTNSIPYNTKICLKWLSSEGRNSVKINFSSIKNPYAHLQYVHNMYAKFEKDPLKTVGEVDYTKKFNFSSVKNPHAHLSICPQHVCKVWKRSIESCGRSWLHKLYTIKTWRTDGQDRQTGANLNAPWLSSWGHKNRLIMQYCKGAENGFQARWKVDEMAMYMRWDESSIWMYMKVDEMAMFLTN